MSVLAVLWLLFVCCKCETLSPHTQPQRRIDGDTTPVVDTKGGTEPEDGAADRLDAAGPPQSAPSPDAAGPPSSPDGKAGENLFGALTKPEEFQKIKEALLAQSKKLETDYDGLKKDLEHHTKQLTDVTKATIQLFASLPGKIQKEMEDLQTRIKESQPTLTDIVKQVEYKEAAAASDDAAAKDEAAASPGEDEAAAAPRQEQDPSPASLNESSGGKNFEDLLSLYQGKYGDPPRNAEELKEFAHRRGIEVDFSELKEFMRGKGWKGHKWDDLDESA